VIHTRVVLPQMPEVKAITPPLPVEWFSPAHGGLPRSDGDDTIGVWDLATGAPVVRPILSGHSHGVRTVATAQLDGRPMIVASVGGDIIRTWDLAARAPVSLDQDRRRATRQLPARSKKIVYATLVVN
jgi:hypothetical protein